jgi:ribosomal-protein-alanine N-acetyltransferase
MTDQSFPVLQTARLVLRQARLEDARPFLQIAQDDAVMRYYGVEPFKSEEQALDAIAWQQRIWAEGTGIRWVITEPGHDAFIGDVGYFKFERQHRRAEVGYLLAQEYWRRGLMTEAMTAVLDYGFVSMGLNRVEALVDPRNAASVGLLHRLGFVQEGLLRDYEFERGAFIDLYMVSLLRREWAPPDH